MTTLTLNCRDRRLRGWFQLAILWLLVVVLLAASGLLASNDGFLALLMPAMILAPVAAFLVAWRYHAPFRVAVLKIDSGYLVILHSWRMVGMGFLFLYAHGVLPGLFAWLAGIGDMLAAFGALIIGSRLLKDQDVARRKVLSWNTFGLLDFAVAIAVGTALRSAYLGGEINTDVMAQLPLSLVPTVVVPLYVITHLMIYLQLRHTP